MNFGQERYSWMEQDPYTGDKMPFYMTYPMQNTLFEETEYEKDCRRMQELYPRDARQIQSLVDRECDRMEYEGSMMYDEQPDKIQFRNIAGKIYDKMKEKYTVQENNDRDENLEMLPENEKEKRYPPGENWLGDMVQVVLLQEMYRRREERRKQRRWY